MNEGNPTHVPPGERQKPASAGEAPPRSTNGAEPLTDGDFELAKPTPVASGPTEGDTSTHDTAAPGTAELGLSERGAAELDAADPVVAEQIVAEPVVVEQTVAEPVGGAGAPGGSGVERPKPLHDPDPYSTPPYGEPGPWAPAPPDRKSVV